MSSSRRVSANHSSNDSAEQAAFIHREILQLIVLLIVAGGGFFVTRAVAANNRNMRLRDAAEWYRQGELAVAAGRLDDAIDAFRRATGRRRGDQRYVLALARALALRHDDDAARSTLLTVRAAAPENPEVNLDLARLAAAHQDVTEALRFYRSAIYAPWPLEQSDARRRVRVELIEFLVTHDQTSRALSELLALSADIPDDAPHHLEVAPLFARARDQGHALDQFQRALRLAPGNHDALVGAGEAAFQLGQYSVARRYLRRASPAAADVSRTREIVELLFSRDPLEPRITASERRKRLVVNFTYATERLGACLTKRGADEAGLQSAAQEFERRLKSASHNQDTSEAGVELIDRIVRHVVQTCGEPTALDEALILIGRRHGVDAQ